jgi:hypothetical protein
MSAAAVAMPDFSARPDPAIDLLRVGHEQAPVLILDRVMTDPSVLVDFAARASPFRPVAQAGNFYPGVRAPAPQPYVQALFESVRGPIAETFGLLGLPRRLTCAYSITTLPPEALRPAQRAPHFDTSDGGQIAVLHYLFETSHGGTSFYRHRSTGWESITPDRSAVYAATLRRELEERSPTPGYAIGDTGLFQRIGGVEGRFDRLIIYRGRMLHSGDIDPPRDLDPSPRTGRLTLNTFITFDGDGRP